MFPGNMIAYRYFPLVLLESTSASLLVQIVQPSIPTLAVGNILLNSLNLCDRSNVCARFPITLHSILTRAIPIPFRFDLLAEYIVLYLYCHRIFYTASLSISSCPPSS